MNYNLVLLFFGYFGIVSSITLDKQTLDSIKGDIGWIQEEAESYFEQMKQFCFLENENATEVPELLQKFKKDKIDGLSDAFETESKKQDPAEYDENKIGLFRNLTTAFKDLKLKLIDMTEYETDCPNDSVLEIYRMFNMEYSRSMRSIFCDLLLCGPRSDCTDRTDRTRKQNECDWNEDKFPFEF